ncbi:hypothetical protein ElyMa_006537600 [Elysia marginata]|uniref:Uncharacterized protein n=1 Tax=Elysia marginata TaxID=1093978 RepID=A0AAV4I6X4_9GAST|nr:hypothetical protein ElyMa_006537600 [Elysia marginata]
MYSNTLHLSPCLTPRPVSGTLVGDFLPSPKTFVGDVSALGRLYRGSHLESNTPGDAKRSVPWITPGVKHAKRSAGCTVDHTWSQTRQEIQKKHCLSFHCLKMIFTSLAYF